MKKTSELSDNQRPTNQPPIPPPLPTQPSHSTRFKIKTRNDVLSSVVSTLERRANHDPSTSDELADFESGYIFLYGSLMDSDVLKHVLKLHETPKLEEATIHGYKIRLWGIYPALIPETNGVIQGKTWAASNREQIMRLAEYETKAYKLCSVSIIRYDGPKVKGKTFCWAGASDSRDLEDGTFDLKTYQTYFKQALLSRGSDFEDNE